MTTCGVNSNDKVGIMHNTNFVIAGGTTGCHNDNLWCHQRWQSWHYDNPCYSLWYTETTWLTIFTLFGTVEHWNVTLPFYHNLSEYKSVIKDRVLTEWREFTGRGGGWTLPLRRQRRLSVRGESITNRSVVANPIWWFQGRCSKNIILILIKVLCKTEVIFHRHWCIWPQHCGYLGQCDLITFHPCYLGQRDLHSSEYSTTNGVNQVTSLGIPRDNNADDNTTFCLSNPSKIAPYCSSW